MLMDEPFGAVDPIVRERLQDEFLRLQEELAKTILFVTHDIDEAIKMGDLVAVFEQGGKVAQFGTPTELLANPASDFVARFVGADRGLKRLSLSRIRDIKLQSAVTGRIGQPAGEARKRALADPLPYLLLVDAQERPMGWLRDVEIEGDGVLTEAMAIPMSPLLSPETTLKDALSMMLDADVHTGIVVDRDGRVSGLVTTEMIGGFLQEPIRAAAEP
jgi:osmoprotectant transport system ATP-binding protein